MSNTYQVQKDDPPVWTLATLRHTSNSATITDEEFKYKIDGKTMFFQIRYRHTAAATRALFYAYLPSGLEVKITTTTGDPLVGTAYTSSTSGAALLMINAKSRYLYFQTDAGSVIGNTASVAGALDDATLLIQGTGMLELE